MVTVCVTLSEQSIAYVEEIAEAIKKAEGEKPSKSRVIRLAIAEMKKNMIAGRANSKSKETAGE